MSRRDYRGRDGEPLVGVTTVLGLLAKPALVGWAARVAAEAAVKAKADGMTDEIALKRGSAAANSKRDNAADSGTSVHALVEAHARGEQVAAGDGAVGRAYRRVVEHFTATGTVIVESEVALSDPDRGFGGTIDFVIERDGVRLLGDLKTGKGVYDETIIQLAAYRDLLTIHRGPPRLQGAVIIHAPLDGPVREYAVSSEQLDHGRAIFDALLKIHRTKPNLKLKG